MLLANVTVWEVAAGSMYTLANVANGVEAPPPNFLDQLRLFFRAQIAVNLLNTCGIWAVKLSFMLFFRKLGDKVTGQKWLWWSVLAALIATFAICIGVYDWPCLVRSLPVILGRFSSASMVLHHLSADATEECPKPAAQAYSKLSLRIITGCDVITDALSKYSR